MRNLHEYLREEYGYVSKWWKYIALGLISLEVVVAAVLWCTYDFQGDLQEHYFNFGDKLLMVGVFEK